MDTYYYILIFLIGLSVGSFFNVIIFRFDRPATEVASPLRRRDSIIWGRSKCRNCDSIIKWFDLIPVLSYFFLKGKCRKCNSKISSLYPATEILTAVVLTLFFLNASGTAFSMVINSVLILSLVLILFLDIRYLTIPDKILVVMAAAVFLLKLPENNLNLYSLVISSLGLVSFFAILFIASKGRWIGLGDLKLIFIMGFLLEFPLNYFAVVLSVWTAAIFSIFLLITGRATAKTEIPFGSFLSATAITFIIFNHEVQEISQYFYQ